VVEDKEEVELGGFGWVGGRGTDPGWGEMDKGGAGLVGPRIWKNALRWRQVWRRGWVGGRLGHNGRVRVGGFTG
jgi:hypothetical protein